MKYISTLRNSKMYFRKYILISNQETYSKCISKH